MRKFKDNEGFQWDAWFVNRQTENGTQTHAFYLRNGPVNDKIDPRIGWSVGHASSYDGFSWTQHDSVLPPLADDTNPEDFHSKFTGCAVNLDDVCYLFYTMREKERTSQRLGVAISADWEHFEPWEGNPVIVNEDTHPIPVATEEGTDRFGTLIGFNNLSQYNWNIVDARDLIIVERDNSDGLGIYSGYYAAAADLGGECPVGVIVMLRSNDLLHWTNPRIVYHVDHHGVLEVPDVFYMDGKWVLCCLSGINYSGRAVTADPYAQNVTIVAYSDSPDGPFLEIEQDNILIAGPVQSGFTCRSFEQQGKRMLVYIDRGDQDPYFRHNSFSLPKELRMDNGRLRPYYTPIPEDKQASPLAISAFNAEQNSFAWKTYGGTATYDASGTLTMKTAPKDYHAVSIPLDADVAREGSVMLHTKMTVDGNGGLFWRCRNVSYSVLLEPKDGRVGLYRLYCFEPLAQRSCSLAYGREYDVRLILIDDVVELYLDNILVLQCGVPTTEGLSHVGFLADRGQMIAREIEIRALL